MILSDISLKKEILGNNLIDKQYYYPEMIQPASIDLRLGNKFMWPAGNKTLSLDEKVEYEEETADSFVIPPQEFVLATTFEYINLPDYMSAFVEGRSSIGRLGLFIQNAGWVDPGFEGRVTLELFNANRTNPVKVKAGRRICQLVVATLNEPAENPYDGKYQNQKDTTKSRIYLDKESRWRDE